MAGEGVLVNVTDVVSSLPQYIIDRLGSLIIILQAVGIAFVAYVLYVIVKMFLGFKNIKRLKVIEKRVNSIEGKLDVLIKGKKKKEKKK